MSKNQVARRERILDAAAELGADVAYDHVQMQEVARAADVALGTLYRYFPSKVHLFAAIYEARIAQFVGEEWPAPGDDPVAIVGDRLVELTRDLLERPLLCSAMVQATSVTFISRPEDEVRQAEDVLSRVILRTLGRGAPSREDSTAVRLLLYSWWGVLVAILSDKTSAADAEDQLRLAVRLMLAERTPGHPSDSGPAAYPSH
ncbi:TetR family transcriptional regulator [Streptomyces sp. NPDC055681]